MIRPQRLATDEQTLTDRFGKFVCAPLERGYGLTLGNALRRILLSSIRGAAVTSVRIEGVLHELSTVPGVLEDVSGMISNLKKIPFRTEGSGPYTVSLFCTGPRVARACDLELPAGVFVVEPERPIATLDRDGCLRMVLTITTGKGYAEAESYRPPGQPIGAIAVDGVYSPIRRVSFKVFDTRVGDSYGDALELSVWTNGAVTPEDAVAIAARIFKDQLVPFMHIDEPLPEPVVKAPPPYHEHLLTPLDELTLSVRAANCMQSANIRLIGDLVQRSDRDILQIRNMGRKTLREIQQSLQELGLSLGMYIPNWNEIRDRGRA
jgi:DNA-directed RNA polymerase subunit alpha